jgi:hypothetical protein
MGYTLTGDPYIVMRAGMNFHNLEVIIKFYNLLGCFTFQDVFGGISVDTWQQKQQLLRCVSAVSLLLIASLSERQPDHPDAGEQFA